MPLFIVSFICIDRSTYYKSTGNEKVQHNMEMDESNRIVF